MKHWTIISFGLVAIGASAYSAGCRTNGCNVDPDCENSTTASTSGGQGGSTPNSCIPKINQTDTGTAVKDECGIFVRLAGDDTNGAGTKSKPVATLAHAIELASDAKATHRIYACAEVFPESIEVPSGIEIYGGLNCAGGAWAYSGKRTTVEAMPDLIPLKFVKANENKIHLEDITARAANSSLPGGSSIAATADAITTLELVRCDFVAGLGGDGESGTTPPGDIMPTDPKDMSIAGVAGSDGCKGGGMGNIGPDGPTNPSCSTSIGGKGGKGLEMLGEDGGNGVPIPADNPNGLGLGGKGSTGAGCLAGADGAAGDVGSAGSSADQPGDIGAFDLGGYHGVGGTSGGKGAPGQGGGGGGGGKGKLNCYGASGGSGGAGGCGGAGGSGGKPGGSSIALISLGATLVFEDVKFEASGGGNGGDGGDGQGGGTGGAAGIGGLQAGAPAPGCAGGKGGSGGQGGKGGGGHGGHSIGIVWQGVIPPELPMGSIIVGNSGKGGAGADVSKGGDGTAQEIFALQ